MRPWGKLFASFFVVATLGGASDAAAQVYPSRPITIVVPFPAGGASSALARVLAEHMRTTLGQPVIVENLSGAGGTLGIGRVARAAPDGYTLIIGQPTSHVIGSMIFPVQYDVLKDFEPVARVADTPVWIVSRNDLPAKDLKELVAWIKAHPGMASEATIGPGSFSHLFGLYLQSRTGTQFQFVPYRGGAPVMQDLVAGHVDFTSDMAANSLPFVQSGQIKALAVLSNRRWFAAPEVPTADELGMPGLYISLWHGIWAPRSTARSVIAKINGAVVAALADPIVQQRFAEQGQEIPPLEDQTPEALGEFHKAEIEKWLPIIRAANIKLN
jgi:tripartite-type tricarboxylate transporter receptor subunit TctC